MEAKSLVATEEDKTLLLGRHRVRPNPSIERTRPGKPGRASHVNVGRQGVTTRLRPTDCHAENMYKILSALVALFIVGSHAESAPLERDERDVRERLAVPS